MSENEKNRKSSKLVSKHNEKGESFNLRRKLFHLTGLIIPFIYLFNLFDYFGFNTFEEYTRSLSVYILLGLVIFMTIMEFLRFNFDYWHNLFMKTIGPIMKEKERDKVHGSIPFLFANAVVIGFFPKSIAICSVLFLNFGDPMAAYLGEKYGTIRFWNGKSLQGTLGGIIGAFGAGLLFFLFLTVFSTTIPDFPLKIYDASGLQINSIIVLLIGAIVSFILELVSGTGLFDDNLTIPIGGGLTMTVLLASLNGHPWDFYINNWRNLMIPLN